MVFIGDKTLEYVDNITQLCSMRSFQAPTDCFHCRHFSSAGTFNAHSIVDVTFRRFKSRMSRALRRTAPVVASRKREGLGRKSPATTMVGCALWHTSVNPIESSQI